jgi:hypothetical protein
MRAAKIAATCMGFESGDFHSDSSDVGSMYGGYRLLSFQLNAQRTGFDYTIRLYVQPHAGGIVGGQVQAASATFSVNGTAVSIVSDSWFKYANLNEVSSKDFSGSFAAAPNSTIGLGVFIDGRRNSGSIDNVQYNLSLIFTYKELTTGLTVVTSGAYLFLLPEMTSDTTSQLYFLKGIDYSPFLKLATRAGITIDGRSNQYINVERKGCVSLFSSSTVWYLASYYTGDMGGTTTVVTDATKRSTATANAINIFRTDDAPNRSGGDNHCILPNPAGNAGTLCFVAYGGSSYKGGGNALSFSTPSGSIDTYAAWDFPYITVDDGVKSTGAVFISDGTNWYIVGKSDSYCVEWKTDQPDNTDNLNRSLTIPGQNGVSIFLSPSTMGTLRYTLPQIENALSIVKLQAVTNYGVLYYANDNGGTTNKINENAVRMRNACAGGKSYAANWFVSVRRNGILYYYPILSYYP